MTLFLILIIIFNIYIKINILTHKIFLAILFRVENKSPPKTGHDKKFENNINVIGDVCDLSAGCVGCEKPPCKQE
jgi:hypothetical protein